MIKIIKKEIHIAEMHNIVEGALDLVNPIRKSLMFPKHAKQVILFYIPNESRR